MNPDAHSFTADLAPTHNAGAWFLATDSVVGCGQSSGAVVVFGLIAFVDAPSFQGMPWIGLLTLGLYALAGAAAILAATRGPQTARDVNLPRPETWERWFMLLPLLLLFGPIAWGPIAVPVAAGAVGASGLLFLRSHDARARSGHRLLSRRGLSRAVDHLKRRRAGQAKRPKPGPRSVREWMRSFSGGEGRISSEQLVAPTVAVVSDDPLVLVRKDGSPADSAEPDGEESDRLGAVRELLEAALEADATGIEIVPGEHDAVVRHRIDGVYEDARRLDRPHASDVITTLGTLAGLADSTAAGHAAGAFLARRGEARFDIRATSTLSQHGPWLALRLRLSSGNVAPGLDSLGLRAPLLKQVREIVHRPHGMFLVTGPTVSGKTTTASAAVGEIDTHRNAIVTVENPIEFRLDGVKQISVDEPSGAWFPSVLRDVLRQDPDVVFVGEIADRETAEIACQAALTGHFVFATLEARDAVAAISRLLELGLEPALIQSAVTAVLGQRLARRLCTACREAVPPPAGLEKRFNLREAGIKHIYRERGCEECRGTGYRGQIGVHEMLVTTDDVRRLVTATPAVDELREVASRGGTRSLQTDGLMKVCRGITSTNEILRTTT